MDLDILTKQRRTARIVRREKPKDAVAHVQTQISVPAPLLAKGLSDA